jgi:hypothetical protein
MQCTHRQVLPAGYEPPNGFKPSDCDSDTYTARLFNEVLGRTDITAEQIAGCVHLVKGGQWKSDRRWHAMK